MGAGSAQAPASLAWLLSEPVGTSVIARAKRLGQLEDTIAAIGLELSEDWIAKLEAAGELPPEHLGSMLATQGADRMGPVDLWAGKTSLLRDPNFFADLLRTRVLPLVARVAD